MADCDYSAELGAYLDGELDSSRRAAVESHLAVCPACAAELKRLTALSHMIGTAPAARLSPFALHRMHAATDRAMEAGFVRTARVLAALAACVLAASSLWMWRAKPAAPLEAAPPWVDVVSPSDDSVSSATVTPAAQWYLANAGNRGEE